MSFLPWFKKEKQAQKQVSVEWPEITVDTAEPRHSADFKQSLDRDIAAVFGGKLDTLSARPILAAFIQSGWEKVVPLVTPMVLGKTYGAPWALGEIFSAFPEESATRYLAKWREMPSKNVLMLLAALGQGWEEQVATICISLLPSLPQDEVFDAIELLGRFSTKQGNAILAAYLQDEDWRLALKAATALEAATAVEFLPQIEAAANKGGLLGQSLEEIIQRMK